MTSKAQPCCPECTSQRLYRNGLRYLTDGSTVQRWLCRECGYRFSESGSTRSNKPEHVQKSHSSALNSADTYLVSSQICVTETIGAKNLAKMEPLKAGLAGATRDAKGKIVEWTWQLQKQGYKASTIKIWNRTLRKLSRESDILDPESVKEALAKMEGSENYKANIVIAYSAFCRTFNIQWKPPKYVIRRKKPFIPTEKELDALICCCGRKMSVYLRTLKETGMRSGEACKLKWIDVDKERNTITVNAPEKNSNPRTLRVSQELIATLYSLPKTNEKVFGKATRPTMESNFVIQRKNAVRKLQNPRINYIHFHTFRHWKATMEYHKTKDILYVQQMLGHKRIDSTLLYTQLVDFREHEYACKVASTVKEAKKLVEAGFEYVTDFDDKKLFRKRK